MTLRRIRSLSDLTSADRGASAAMGNFDGMHLGHQAVLDHARRPDAPLALVTFEPHPREVFRPDDPPFRLMNPEAKARRAEQLGVELLFELPFDGALRGLSERAFCQEILADGLGLSHVAVGADFRFGKGRTGDADGLRRAGADMGFAVTVAEMVPQNGEQVSSTAIRTALTAGDCTTAQQMLGHHHRIEGPVIHGEKRGRDLGFPTANMDLTGLHLPRFGVYAVLVDVCDGPHQGSYLGAASLGVRPMFGQNTPNLETYLFDFQGDLYGATLSVALVAFLRPEAAFEGVDALVKQMDTDCREARNILEPISTAGA